jgi:nucleotide-binding universal stress UspA family protein
VAFKRILCAVDFSPNALEAFRVAVEFVRLYSGSLHIFHVLEAQPVVSEWLPIEGMGKVAIEIEKKAIDALESLVAHAKPSLEGRSVTAEVASGRAFVEIVTRAQEWKPDLIVLGSKGLASLEDIIVGSTAERVVKAASCSVLVVRPPESEAQDNSDELSRGRGTPH